jgi:hypothetical protein
VIRDVRVSYIGRWVRRKTTSEKRRKRRMERREVSCEARFYLTLLMLVKSILNHSVQRSALNLQQREEGRERLARGAGQYKLDFHSSTSPFASSDAERKGKKAKWQDGPHVRRHCLRQPREE